MNTLIVCTLFSFVFSSAQAQLLLEDKETPNVVKKSHLRPYHIGNKMSSASNAGDSVDEIVTPAAPPLIFLDDAGTPDPGQVEINFTFDGDLNHGEKEFDAPVYDVNLGMVVLGKRIQLKYEVPTVISARSEGTKITPVGASNVGVKLPMPFLDEFIHRYSEEWDLAIYPQVEFRTPGAGILDVDENQTTVQLPVIIQRKFEHFRIDGVDLGPISVVANFGYNRVLETSHNPNPYGQDTWHASVGVAKKITPRLDMMAEVGSAETVHHHSPDFVAATTGVIYRLVDNKLYIYSGAGMDLVRRGEDRHFYIVSGLKWLFDSGLGKNKLVGRYFRD